MHAAMTASSSRAGTIAGTEPAVAAGTAVPMEGKLWASLGIVYWMRKDCFPIRAGWVSIAFDENPSKNCGLGRGGGCAWGFALLWDAELPPGRGLDCWKDSGGLSAGNHREARASHRSEGQGRHTEFLGDLVPPLRRRDSRAKPLAEMHRVAKRRHPRRRCR